MRIYEELFVVRPDVTDEEIDPLIEQITTLIASKGGNVEKSDKWGVRKLAYRVQKHTEGYYVLLQFTASPDAVMEIERRLRVADMVMKFITVRIDQKLKKIDKRKKTREKRAARRPAPPVAAPSMPLGEPVAAGPTPGAPMPGAPMPSAAPPAAGLAQPVAPEHGEPVTAEHITAEPVTPEPVAAEPIVEKEQ